MQIGRLLCRVVPVVIAGAVICSTGVAVAGNRNPVLGYRNLMGGLGAGWGQSAPREVNWGGSPGGAFGHLTWLGWGRETAIARGSALQYRPGGGVYKRPVAAELKATTLVSCDGHLSYLWLFGRKARMPGASALGRWDAGTRLCPAHLTQPAVLPFSGAPHLAWLAAVGLAALLVGSATHLLGSRKRNLAGEAPLGPGAFRG